MNITSITLWHIPLATLQISQNQRVATGVETTSVVVALTTSDGLAGWGEICPLPGAAPVFVDGIAPAIAEMSDVLLGADIAGPAAFMPKLDAHLPGHAQAKSAIDMALWDLAGKEAGLPVHAMLGGRHAAGLPVCQDIGPMAADEVVEAAKLSMSGGVTTFRVALGHDGDWRRDADRLNALRDTVGPRATVIGDWRGRGNRVNAIRTARETSGLDLILEQPCGSDVENAAVRLASGQVMKLDERLTTPQDVLAAHAAGVLDAATIKPSRLGGITPALRMRDLCMALGVPVSVEEIAGSDIAMSALLQVASTTPKNMLLFTQDISGQLSPRIDRFGPTRRAGMIAAPDAPGLGIEPDLDAMGAPLAVIE